MASRLPDFTARSNGVLPLTSVCADAHATADERLGGGERNRKRSCVQDVQDNAKSGEQPVAVLQRASSSGLSVRGVLDPRHVAC